MIRKIRLYIAFVLMFALWHLIFMLYHWDIYGAYPFGDWLASVWHGLPHDLTVAGYLMVVPALLELVRIWMPGPWHRTAMVWYLRIIIVPVLLVLFTDIELYTHWGFRLDATPLIYLTDNPVDAVAQAPVWALIVLPLVLAGIWWIVVRRLVALFPPRQAGTIVYTPSVRVRMWKTASWLVLTALLFVAIRGGVTTSTMNVGRVYFSTEMPLNHAATNPVFSLFSSLGKSEDFGSMYRFMTEEQRAAAIDEMTPRQDVSTTEPAPADTLGAEIADSDMPLLRTSRPNIVIILLESFSGAACAAIEPTADPSVMPTINGLYQTGIAFTQMYANSFRTDRGVAAVLAAYPAPPTYSVMKNAQKAENLTYLTGRLAEAGYGLQFLHGGDADFTNMRGFLRSGGVTDIVADVDFPLADRLSKWGVPDHITFDYLRDAILRDTTPDAPFCKVFLTLSSHEPFDVPYHHFDDLYINSVAYTDSCLGAFLDDLRATPAWDNLLVVGVPDHCFARYPATIQNHEPLRYHIPCFMTGGAVAAPRIVETIASQTDLAATLLSALGLPHDDFVFSHDIMSPDVPHFAFYTWPDGFGMLTDSCRYIQDNAHDGHALSGSDDPHGTAERRGKAYLQTLYDDLAAR